MSDELYEIAFRGQIADGADLDQVKQNIARIFKADDKRLEQLFSGRRVVIKREVDGLTMAKYRGAFEKAGAVCEIRSLSDAPAEAPTAGESSPAPAQSTATTASPADDGGDYQSRYAESEVVPQALLTEPLGVRGEEINDLQADVAPVGSPMQDQIKDVPDAQIDLSGLDVAPVGSDLSDNEEQPPPPPPDTSGITMAD